MTIIIPIWLVWILGIFVGLPLFSISITYLVFLGIEIGFRFGLFSNDGND